MVYRKSLVFRKTLDAPPAAAASAPSKDGKPAAAAPPRAQNDTFSTGNLTNLVLNHACVRWRVRECVYLFVLSCRVCAQLVSDAEKIGYVRICDLLWGLRFAENVHAREGLACCARVAPARVAYAPRLRLRQALSRMLWSQNSKT